MPNNKDDAHQPHLLTGANVTAVLVAVLSALLGIIGALVVNLINSRRSERVELTTALIAEYFSASFLQHRISIGNTSQRVRSGAVQFHEIAAGYWYPGTRDSFRGDSFGGLNEHQHIEAYIGFISRIGYLLSVRRVYVGELQEALGTKMVWEDYLMSGLIQACVEQTRTAGSEPPGWVKSAKIVHEKIVIHPKMQR